MGRISKVVNRNGEVVPFRRNRIVRAILASVRGAGSKEEWVADKLADMVVYFLDMQHGEAAAPPTADDVDDMIEKALLSSPDLGPIARAFMSGREQRREIRELEETIASEPARGPQVAQPEQGLGGWNRARIAAAVMRENGVNANVAGEVAETVETKVHELNLPRVTTGLIRELVDVDLLSRGLIHEPGSVTVPRYDLEQWVFPGEETELPPASQQSELSERAARRVLSDYALRSILPAPVREAHLDGGLQIEGLHAPAAVIETRLDVPALLKSGAGFGLQRMFGQSTHGVGAAFARLATMVGAASSFTSGPVALTQFDTALAQQVQDDPDQIDRAEIQDGLRLLAAQAGAGLVIEVGPPGDVARDLVARTIMDTLAGSEGSLRRQVQLELSVTAGAFADPARRSLLERASSGASFCGVPRFRLKEPGTDNAGGMFGDVGGLSHRVTVARAGINLMRPALEHTDVTRYLEALDPLIELAVSGLSVRAQYLERVAMRDLPEPVPTPSRMIRALVGTSRDVVLTPVGLGLASSRLADDDDDAGIQRLAQQVLSYLSFKFKELCLRRSLNGQLGATLIGPGTQRLAREDGALVTRRDPESSLRLKLARDGAYQLGAGTDLSLPLSARLENESALHSLLGRDAEVSTSREESLTSAEVMETLRACTSESGARPTRLTIRVQTRTCRDCGARYPAARESCPVCDSTAWAVPPGQKSLFG